MIKFSSGVLVNIHVSGHGYKFSSAVGEALGELIIHGETTQDISPFKITRDSLQPENKDEVYFKARGK